MNQELKRIEKYLISRKFEEKSYKDLSRPKANKDSRIPTSLIDDITNKAFCFDDISDSFYDKRLHLSSADALLLKDNLYLIELKPIGSKKLDHEISKKIIESFHTLRERVFKDNNTDPSKFEIHFILIREDNALDKYSEAIEQKTKKRFSNPKTTPLPPDNEPFDKYKQRYIDNNKRVYYDSVEIWEKSEFLNKITKLK